MVTQTAGYIDVVAGNRFAIESHQYVFQIRLSVTVPTPDPNDRSSLAIHHDFLTKLVGTI